MGGTGTVAAGMEGSGEDSTGSSTSRASHTETATTVDGTSSWRMLDEVETKLLEGGPTQSAQPREELVDATQFLQALKDIELEIRDIDRKRWCLEARASGQVQPQPTYRGLRANFLRGLPDGQRDALDVGETTVSPTDAASAAASSPAGSDRTIRAPNQTTPTNNTPATQDRTMTDLANTQPTMTNNKQVIDPLTQLDPLGWGYSPDTSRFVYDRWGNATWLHN